MAHWEYTEEIKRWSRKARRQVEKDLERKAKQMRGAGLDRTPG